MYRCYHFGNFYLSSIQQGIQAAHCQMELAIKYPQDVLCLGSGEQIRKFWEWSKTHETMIRLDEQINMFWDWAKNHKTMICLNGGMYSTMKELWEFLDTRDNEYPYAKFHEAEDAMNGMLTNIAIVLPEKIYEASRLLRNKNNIFIEFPNKLSIPDYSIVDKDLVDRLCELTYSKFEKDLVNKLGNYSLAK